MAGKNNIFDRYTSGARLNHWINAILMICLVLSGMALFHPSLFFLTELFGGGPTARIVHPWIGVLAMLSFLGLFIRFVRFNLWNKDDSAWMRNVKHVVAGDEAKVPEAGKYNAGQKLVFWLMSILTILLLTSGLAMWASQLGEYTTIEQKRLAAVVHSASAVLLLIVVITHVYAAIWVRGTIRGMTRGSVTGGWAWRHHRKWLREEVGKSK
ncbi:MAG: formate dehydrogenase subunit gamma [Alphaproteobacteria bacterium]|nr:formate dehydrogenase subunit gamma [Alphaproteobacteria bacterium]MCW5742611.1 formate dehydrogenase subunit gamma [Alphaproteobacteria bacterium]